MGAAASGLGPDLVIAGAARSGTSSLAAQLREHPAIDPGATKEPNFFSRSYDRGPDWYDGLFSPRTPGLLRMDASTSYTYPEFPDALHRLAKSAPDALVVYIVREPVARAISHYLLRRYTLALEPAETFGAALRTGTLYTGTSDYAHWLGELRATFAEESLLVVPFDAVTRSNREVGAVICRRLGLPPPPEAAKAVSAHRNQVVEFRAEGARRAVSAMRRSQLYPRLRTAIGASRVRRLRSLLIRPSALPSGEQALASCDEVQHRKLAELQASANAAVQEQLARQDARCGLDWATYWTA